MLNGEDYETIDGTCVRDYIHVDDLAEAHILALNLLAQEKTLFDVFNLGNGQGFSVKQVIATTRKITGHPIPVEIGSRRPGDAPKLVANCEKAKQILGWQPQHTDLETIISSAWAWHKNHPKGFES
jgi:UDP-glucose 4-epimerase